MYKLKLACKKFSMSFQKEVVLLLLMSLFLGSCASLPATSPYAIPPVPADGMVHAMNMGNVIWGMKAAIAEKPGTLIMMKDSQVLLMWSLKNRGWAFVAIDASNKLTLSNFVNVIGGRGNLINGKETQALIDVLKNNGWKAVSASQVPEVIKIALATSSSWLTTMASNMTTFLFVVVPVNSNYWFEIQREYQET